MDKSIVDNFMVEMGNLLKSAKDFTVEQAPQVAKEILHYNLASCIVWLILGIAGGIATWKFCMWIAKKGEDDSDYNGFYMLAAIPAIVSMLILESNAMEIVKIYLAPRLYLIEYFADLVKK